LRVRREENKAAGILDSAEGRREKGPPSVANRGPEEELDRGRATWLTGGP
jgi:hypothetical protein